MYFKTLNRVDVKNKKVFVRVDLNVPMDGKNVADYFRIKTLIPTIEYLLANKAKIILASHLGRPSGRDKNFSMNLIASNVSKILKRKVIVAPDCIGSEVKQFIKGSSLDEIVLLENLRFYPEEENNDIDFARELASLADLYVNEAFSVCHREHASIVGITKFLEGVAGFYLEKEVNILTKAIENPDRPLIIIMGGAKAETKVKIIKRMLKKADNILLGGVLANIILKARGLEVGKIENFQLDIEENFDINNSKLVLPIDAITTIKDGDNRNTEEKKINNISFNDIIYDIGPESVEKFIDIIKNAETIIWNGPMGSFEDDKFSHGTKKLARAVAASKAYTIIGGGDTIAAFTKFKLLDRINHISTGGGAMLSFIEGSDMPGLDVLC